MATKPLNRRKVVFFLGAGASLGAGARARVQRGGTLPIPTQSDFWATFLRFCSDKDRARVIESFLFRYFLGYRRVPGKVRPYKRRQYLAGVDVEEVFTFLSERIRASSTSPQLRNHSENVWDALVTEIGPVFRRFPPNSDTRNVYQRLTKNLIRSRDAVVSFNYDTVFECSLAPKTDWAYEGIESRTKKLPILKPHGSINWQNTNPIQVKTEPESSVVVAPTHLKFVSIEGQGDEGIGYLHQASQVQRVWRLMEGHMKTAYALVFIGYSFPPADLYFSSVLRSVLDVRSAPPAVVVVNPNAVEISKRLRSRFYIPKVISHFELQNFADTSRRQLRDQILRA